MNGDREQVRHDALLRELSELDVAIARLSERMTAVEGGPRRGFLWRLTSRRAPAPAGPTVTAADGSKLERRGSC